MIRILVDADACPVKAEIYKVAARTGARAVIVANDFIAIPREDWVERVLVSGGFDAADDWIAEAARPGDVVVTADTPLAARCVKAGAAVITPAGRILDDASVGMALATRNLMADLRATGEVTGGPKPFSARDRSKFLEALDREIVKLRRAGAG
ncbi:MAG TPA: YaiI/YqxD family protein [Stellaceae bacterium]|nr:YaiI/YqxD family protein [Stellaceae bacterium]